MIKFLRKLNRKRNYKTKKIKNIFKAIAFDSWLRKRTKLPNIDQVSSVVLLNVYRGIGDAIIMSGLIHELANRGLKVSVIAESRTSFVFERSSDVYKVHKVDNIESFNWKEITSKEYDVLIDINDIDHNSPHRLEIIKKTEAEHVIGINQKILSSYDTSLKYDDKISHVSNRHKSILAALGINKKNYDYYFDIPEIDEIKTNVFLEKFEFDKLVVLNPYATEKSRNLSEFQIVKLTNFLSNYKGVLTVIIGCQEKISKISLPENVVTLPFSSFYCAAQALRMSDVVVSPDTSIVHLARAFDKNLICLYNNKISPDGEHINTVWGPNYSKATQLLSPSKEVSDIDSEMIINLIKEALF